MKTKTSQLATKLNIDIGNPLFVCVNRKVTGRNARRSRGKGRAFVVTLRWVSRLLPINMKGKEMAKTTDSTSLYFTAGSSDKEYHASIEPRDDGFIVTVAYGRRGSTLQAGTKTPTPVDYATAKKTYDKVVNEKLAKGYTPGESGVPYQQTSKEERATGVFPQLLNAIDEAEVAKLIADSDWCMQAKYDGKRILLRRQGAKVEGINRKGLIVALPESIVGAAMKIEGTTFLLDGECIGGEFVVFDLLESGKHDHRSAPYRDRHAWLCDLVPPQTAIAIAPIYHSADHKTTMFDQLRKQRAEGVVFKRMDAAYTSGRPASGGDQLKHKFYATASCLVAKINGTKRSVALMLLDGKRHVGVGNVTIPPNHEIPKKGEIVEVRYLYAYDGGSLYQPVYLGKRDDLNEADCRLEQLKHKPIGDDES